MQALTLLYQFQTTKKELQHLEKVWFVTGASKGLGADLVWRLLAEGYRVAATSRNRQAMIDMVGEQRILFASRH